MTGPLVFTPGAAATAFNSVAAVWFVFELVMNVRQRWRARSTGVRIDPTFWVLYVCIVGPVLLSQARIPPRSASSAAPSAPTMTSSPPTANASSQAYCNGHLPW